MAIAIVGCTLILTIGGVLFNQIYKNHQANELIIEKCFENFDKVDEVVIKKDGFWSPVICIKKQHKKKLFKIFLCNPLHIFLLVFKQWKTLFATVSFFALKISVLYLVIQKQLLKTIAPSQNWALPIKLANFRFLPTPKLDCILHKGTTL